jgi:hypothetical protein
MLECTTPELPLVKPLQSFRNRTSEWNVKSGLRRPCCFIAGILAALLIVRQSSGAESATKPLDRRQGDERVRAGLKDDSRRARSRPDRTSRSDRAADDLFGISWFKSIDRAGKVAGRGKPLDEGKPIFCFRVLGDLAGFM